MTDPVILKYCDACDERTLHARDQHAEPDPARVVTEHICSECGSVQTKTQKLNI